MDTNKESLLVDIRGKDALSFLNALKSIIASEYLSCHMYRSAYYMCRGHRRISIIDEFKKHAAEELDHATELEERLMLLGGQTFSSPMEWEMWSEYGVPEITTSDIPTILNVIEQAERQAIEAYTKFYNREDIDPVTQDLVVKILGVEQEHLFDAVHNFKGE